MHPKNLSIDDFTYELPEERIALHPVHPRDTSKLLIFDDGMVTQDVYRNLQHHLPEDATLVFNDTRVIKARIFFTKETGAVIEIFCLEPFEKFTNYDTLFQQTGNSLWKCMIGKVGKWKEKQLVRKLNMGGNPVTLFAELVEKLEDAYVVRFSWTPGDFAFGEIIAAAGLTPLPPYIKRKAEEEDETDYQTVFSIHEGSVAAPTAGLHFSEEMMRHFKDAGIPTLFTTLHVGAGTFKPVKSKTMEGHIMHAEWSNITTNFLEQLIAHIDRKIIAVGTTATRTLETIYWMGNKILNKKEIAADELKIGQWEAYDFSQVNETTPALQALLNWMKERNLSHLMTETEIIIAPGYTFRVVDGLVTNFHQPRSTLLLLVAALAGDDWKRIYDYALQNDFRFLSYGDGCLILPRREGVEELEWLR